jgi:protein involved in polysaccharide export with SLBB domain
MSNKGFCKAAVAALVTVAVSLVGASVVLAQTTTSPDVQSILNAISGQPAPTAQTPTTQQVPTATTAPTQTTIAPVGLSTPQAQSQLETLYSQRAGRPLTQFGYDMFGVGASVPVTQIGGVQDNYILGAGDQINVVLRGHEQSAYTVLVDRDGRIILPELAPISAAGRTFGEVRDEISQRVAKQLIGTQAFVSIGTVRQIAVLVSGAVMSPGVRTLTGLNSPIDAILLSGGIKKTGSLRNIIVDHGGRRTRLDLYSVLTGRTTSAIGALTEGDRIIVPAIGPTIAVTGLVQNPGIYELPDSAKATTAESLLVLAGGTELAGAKRLTKLELEPDGKTRMVAVVKNGIVRAGEVLFVDFERSAATGQVTLSGEVALPGTYSLGEKPTISRLIRDNDDLTPQSYSLFGIVVRREPHSNFQAIVPFSIARTFEHKEDLKLEDSDEVYVFSQSALAALAAAADAAVNGSSASQNPLAVLRPPSPTGSTSTSASAPSVAPGTPTPSLGQAPPSGSFSAPPASAPQSPVAGAPATPSSIGAALQAANVPASSAVPAAPTSGLPSTSAAVVGVAQSQATQTATGGAAATVASSKTGTQVVSLDQIAASLGIPTIELVNASRDYLVSITGEVRNPGSYLAVRDTSLAALVLAAGGLQREADLSAVEITSTIIDATSGTSRTVRNSYQISGPELASISLKPFDSVRVRPVFADRNNETVTILGQVRYPGTFDITRGERLSSVLMRAGGLTDEAYPFGTVFTRQSAAIQEAEGNQQTSRLLEDNIATAATLPSTLINPSGLQYVEGIAQALRTAPALGRISVTADPVVLATKPELDVLMESGDTIYIPKRPSSVMVTGEVLNSGAFAYRPGLSVGDYIKLAGGESGASDDSLTFVVLPDGTARPEGSSWFDFGGGHEIPPGSMIVVPRDPQPFNFMLFMINISDILSKLAITAASLAVVGGK